MTDEDQPKRNWDPRRANHFVGRVMNVQKDIDVIKAEAAEKTAPHYEDVAAIKKQAADEGIPREELNKLIASAKRAKKDVDAYDKCDDDQKENIDIMRDELGFIPMSQVREQLVFDLG